MKARGGEQNLGEILGMSRGGGGGGVLNQKIEGHIKANPAYLKVGLN